MAVFDFANAHKIAVCNPPAGRITGTLTVFADGAYDLQFSADGQTIATWSGQCAAGDNPVDCPHSAKGPGSQTFQKNVAVAVNGASGGLVVPMCLKA